MRSTPGRPDHNHTEPSTQGGFVMKFFIRGMDAIRNPEDLESTGHLTKDQAMPYPKHKTTIDQHRGIHDPSGLPIYALTDVVTDLSPYADRAWDDLSADDREWWVDVTSAYHAARVALASLEADARERIQSIVEEDVACELDNQALAIYHAIAQFGGPPLLGGR
jgi:hypothetical protein